MRVQEVGRKIFAYAAAALIGVALPMCDDDDDEYLWSVRNCRSDDDCVEENSLYDRCFWVCEAHITYCRASCETDEDCLGRGLPDDWVFCDTPRPGEGFCNNHGFSYEEGACVQDVPVLGEDGEGAG